MSAAHQQPCDFATTHWSMVLAAGGEDPTRARAALETLCATYWYPLYAYVRRQGHDPVASQDLTQGFFARLLERKDLQAVDPERGRFRWFLLGAMKHFLMNEWDRQRAAKRGGGRKALSLDFADAERRYALEPACSQTPDTIYERQWALALLDQVRRRLRDEAAAAGKLEQFDRLEVYLTGDHLAATYGEVARQLGMSEAAVKVAVHRLRRKFRERLREEIAETVAAAEEIDAEIRDLFNALRK